MRTKHLLFTVLFTLFCTCTWAYDFESGGIYYNLYGEQEVSVTSGNYTGNITIPGTVNYNGQNYTVATIETDAFRYCNGLLSVNISENIRYIDNYAFSDCGQLKTVNIPRSLTSFGTGCFSYCISLESIHIPENVDFISSDAFKGCNNLSAIEVTKENRIYSSINGVLFDKEQQNLIKFPSGYKQKVYTIPNSTVRIDNYAFEGISNFTIIIPEGLQRLQSFINCQNLTIQYNAVNCGESYLEWGEAINSLTIGENVQNLSEYIFSNCPNLKTLNYLAINCSYQNYSSQAGWTNITSLTIGDKVESIPEHLFYGCNKITEITIPASVTSIGNEAFGECNNLRTLNYNAANIINGTNLGWGMPGWRSITTLKLGETVKTIPQRFFEGCHELTKVNLPQSITKIGEQAFANCSKLTAITIPENLTELERSSFSNCNNLTTVIYNAINCNAQEPAWHTITSATIGEKVKTIPDELFRGCDGLTQINIPENITKIGSGAFSYCSGLTEITIPASVNEMGDYVFDGCHNLKSLIWKASEVKSCGTDLLAECSSLEELTAPCEILQTSTDYLSSVAYLPQKLQSVTFTGGEIDESGFKLLNLSKRTLSTIDMTKACNEEIADEAFENCYRLENVMFPSTLKHIGYKSLAECSALGSVTLPETLQEIGDRAFENCYKLQSINWQNTNSDLKRIGDRAFFNCHSLQTVKVPEGVNEIGIAAFMGCMYMENIELPASVTRIGNNSFADNTKIKNITVRALTPPSIEQYTFHNVNRDIPVYVPAEALSQYASHPYWKEFDLHGTESGSTAQQSTNSMEESVFVQGNDIIITGNNITSVSVYDTTGRRIVQTSNTRITIPQSGIYVVKTNNKTEKIIIE